MSKYILINQMDVQNANAIAGFTWGFPAVTHFLGFSHLLSRRLSNSPFENIFLSGCSVIAHKHRVHSYKDQHGNVYFTQNRNPPYLKSHKKKEPPPIIEEGKMNMTVSLLIKCEGNIGNKKERFILWLNNICKLQRLAGGTVLNIKAIEVISLTDESLRNIKGKLLPGFILLDRSSYLKKHYQKLQAENDGAELSEAWLDFIALKQKARPKSEEINKHFQKLKLKDNDNNDNHEKEELGNKWNNHLQGEYQKNNIPDEIAKYFSKMENNEKLLKEWEKYSNPTDNQTDSNWEYVPKPETGYLVPIMTGYKAISKTYKNEEIEDVRDSETDVCFVEAVHSIGEWRSVHRLNLDDIKNSLWNYSYKDNWYLCVQED